jgi:hypothetical protein
MSPATPHAVPELVAVERSDRVYDAHAYLTKVSVTAATPLSRRSPTPGTSLRPLRGLWDDGRGAAMTGRRAELNDISELGRHVESG